VLNDGSVVNLEPETALRVDLGKVSATSYSHGRGVPCKDPLAFLSFTRASASCRTIFGVEQEPEHHRHRLGRQSRRHPLVALSRTRALEFAGESSPNLSPRNAPREYAKLCPARIKEREGPAQREGETSSPPGSAKGYSEPDG